MTGIGGNVPGNDNYGVLLNGNGTRISSVNGNISIKGLAGAGSGAINIGVKMVNYAKVSSLGIGNVSVSGTAGYGSGTYNLAALITGAGTTISTARGRVTLGSDEGIFTVSGGATVSAAGQLRIIAATFNLELPLTSTAQQPQTVSLLSGSSVYVAGNISITTSIPQSVPVVGTRFTVIHNVGVSRIVGLFTDVAEGSIIVVGSMRYSVTYRGGTGFNDMQLVAIR